MSEPEVKTLDREHVVVLVTDKEGNIARIGTPRMYADLIIADAKKQPWYKNAVIEENPAKEAT